MYVYACIYVCVGGLLNIAPELGNPGLEALARHSAVLLLIADLYKHELKPAKFRVSRLRNETSYNGSLSFSTSNFGRKLTKDYDSD